VKSNKESVCFLNALFSVSVFLQINRVIPVD
jgi:hypothetical protein